MAARDNPGAFGVFETIDTLVMDLDDSVDQYLTPQKTIRQAVGPLLHPIEAAGKVILPKGPHMVFS